MRSLAFLGLGILSAPIAKAAFPDLGFPGLFVPILVYAVALCAIYSYLLERIEATR